MPVISEEGKYARKRGTGKGADYKPWILTRELNSIGTTANIIDWKHGRAIHLLSEGEEMYYYLLRWDDNVVDIREQFPLILEDTVRIAAEYGIRHPGTTKRTMTTDLLVTYSDGSLCAYSVKDSRKSVDAELADTEEAKRKALRTAEKLFIEKSYWVEKGIKWKLVYKEDLNRTEIDNIRRVVQYYDPETVHDEISKLKHKIATKQIHVDMKKALDYKSLFRQCGKEF